MHLDSTRTIPLTKGYVALVDAVDYPMLSRFTWHVTNKGYAVRGQHPHVLMSRVIMLPDPGLEVDHVNRNKLDNRRRNLRICEHRGNARNAARRVDNASGYKGVSWRSDVKKWRVRLANGGQKYLGLFDDKLDAARAYDAAARELFGEFACLNLTDSERPESGIALVIDLVKLTQVK